MLTPCGFCKFPTFSLTFSFRKGTTAKPVVNKQIFKEYETFFKRIFGSVDIQGPPLEIKDPRPEYKGRVHRILLKSSI